ncbi:hypothetical protein [Candidatus Regiella insecticola]|uniref:Uncharacterized protein n=1 Tax=Candidatus Regiella insecticola TaxID=138073 RepID=A0A6L2ZRE0_9ENTR|nr:hypothetical protein [Candidatus Regiella insecticola]GFN47030.1 hypothetical protein RINTU1_28790 [Candidatus Regiella insecticola]
MPNNIEAVLPTTNPISLANNTQGTPTRVGLSLIGVCNVSSKMYNLLCGAAVIGGTSLIMGSSWLIAAYGTNDLYESQSGSERVFNEETLQVIKKMTIGVAAFMSAQVSLYFHHRAEDMQKFPERMRALPVEVQREFQDIINRGDKEGLEAKLQQYKMWRPFFELSRA